MTAIIPQQADADLAEAVQLGAADGVFFSRFFFPKAMRQASPKMHYDVWDLIDLPDARLVGIEIFRGGAKTTICRIAAARRIGYGLTRTVLYIGKSGEHAQRSVQWLQRAVMFNSLYAGAFQLSKGDKWSPSGGEITIYHGILDIMITVIALGITGSIRGVNVDDYRPDLIVIDDVVDDENAATAVQREKVEDLVMGGLRESLAPASEAPDAKLIMLGTPQDKSDINELAQQDPEFHSLRFGCWTPETENLPLEQRQSSWPERWPSAVLRKEYQHAVARNQLSIWLREKECKLVSRESADFRAEWLQYWTVLPESGMTILIIDPVPPPSEAQIRKDLRDKDYEAFAVLRASGGKIYLCEYAINRGHDPNWTIATFFALAVKWRIHWYWAESYAYQRTLKWILENAMKERKLYFPFKHRDHDRRSKRDRVVQGLNGPASGGYFFCHQSHVDFIAQFTRYPKVDHDDLLEAVAVGCEILDEDMILEGEYSDVTEDEYEDIVDAEWQAAP